MANGLAARAVPVKDPLLSALGRVCFSGWQGGVGIFPEPWTVEVPAGHVSFYIAAQGSCRLSLQDDEANSIDMHPGDYVLLTQGTAHRMGDQLGSARRSWHDAFLRDSGDRVPPYMSDYATTILAGYLPAHPLGREPLAGILPEIVRANSARDAVLADSQVLVEMASQLRRSARPGWHPIASRLIQVLLLQTVRAYVSECLQAEDVQGRARWLSATTNGSIGTILAQLHEAPERRWTVRSLARQAHMAKSAFSQRFRQTVGRPPLQYLTAYRMEKACEMLLDTNLGIKEIAASVGYDSASSFSNAFKRWRGQAPAAFRRHGLNGTAPCCHESHEG
jgi:AraC family transcriptional regulator, alkane utilization regulator